MSFVTRSGMPALSQETRETVTKEYNAFYDGIKHLQGKEDFNRLFIPTYEDFRRLDIANPAHPMQNRIEANALERYEDMDREKKVSSDYCQGKGTISKEEYEYEMALLYLRELKRQAHFDVRASHKQHIKDQQTKVDYLKTKMSSHIIELSEDAVEQGSEEASD